MWAPILSRITQAAATVVVATLAVFVAVRVLPASPVLARFGQHAVPEKVEQEMAAQGWNQPLWIQAIIFAGNLVQGNLGESFARPGEKVSQRLMQTVPATIELTVAAMVVALPLGILIGVVAAVWSNRWPDWLAMVPALVGVSTPVFFVAICLIILFPFMPSSHRLPPGTFHELRTDFYFFEALLTGQWQLAATALRHLVLPAFALATIPVAVISRVTRNSMLEVLRSDFLRTAKAKGAGAQRIIWRHAFPNASLSVLNIVGFQTGMLLSGAILTETVFNWPGLGRYMVGAIQDYDYAVVQGGAMVVVIVFVSINLMLDLLFTLLDPRLRERPL